MTINYYYNLHYSSIHYNFNFVNFKIIIMKKLIFTVLLLLTASLSIAQKSNKSKKPMAKQEILASVGSLTAEMKNNIFYVSLDNKKPIQDTIQLKIYTDATIPTNCNLKAYSVKGKLLHAISWIEINQKSSELIKEVSTATNTIIFDSTSKTKIFSNTQKSIAITEKHFLDKKQTVSETVNKKRNEGYELLMLPNGVLNLKSKNQNMTLVYDAKQNKYDVAKK